MADPLQAFKLLEQYLITHCSASRAVISNKLQGLEPAEATLAIQHNDELREAAFQFLAFGQILALAVFTGHGDQKILHDGIGFSIYSTYRALSHFIEQERKRVNRGDLYEEIEKLAEAWEQRRLVEPKFRALNAIATSHAFDLLEQYLLTHCARSRVMIATRLDGRDQLDVTRAIQHNDPLREAVFQFLSFGQILALAVKTGYAHEKILYCGIGYSVYSTFDTLSNFVVNERIRGGRPDLYKELEELAGSWKIATSHRDGNATDLVSGCT